MALNELQSNIVNFQDVLNGNNYQVFVSGGVLYMGNTVVAPDISGNLNTNDLMMITANLTSGATAQRIYYPQGYEPTTTPKVVYSIIGEDSSSILAPQLSQVNVDYFELRFSRPVPTEQYYVQATIYKNDDYTTFSGTNVDLNPIRTAKSLYVDTVYGHDGGTFSGRRQNPNFPFFSFQQAHDNASSGDRIYFYPGLHSGINVNKSLFLEFAPGAVIDDVCLVVNSGTCTVKNIDINHKSGSFGVGIAVNAGAQLNLVGQNFIRTNNRNAISTTGAAFNYGELYHNNLIGNNYKNVDGTLTGYYVRTDFSGSALNLSGVNGQFYLPTIQEAIAIASTKAVLNIASGNYSGINLDKSIILNFEPGATVSGRIGISGNREVDFYNLDVNISDVGQVFGGLNLSGVANFYGENKIRTTNGISITGSGQVNCYGDLYYNGLFDSRIKFDKGTTILVDSTVDQKGFSGSNGTIQFLNLQRAVDFATGNQKIVVAGGTYTGFSYSGKQNLNFSFSNETIVIPPVNISGASQNVYFNGMYLDARTDSGINYGLNLASGTTGWLRDSYIRLPYTRINYFVTGSGSSGAFFDLPSGSLALTSVVYAPGLSVYFDYYASGNFGVTMTGVSGGLSGLRNVGNKYSVSGSGGIVFGDSIYNQLPWSGITNLLGNTNGFNSGAALFNPYSYVL